MELSLVPGLEGIIKIYESIMIPPKNVAEEELNEASGLKEVGADHV